MLLLLLFALIAGAGTAITPCVLPVVPALLSASAAGGRRRPLGIVLGLAIAFTIAIVALAKLVQGVGLAAGAARTLAIVVLVGFGVVLLIPELAERVEAPLSRLARFGPRTRGDGFWSGLGVGAALGFVCAPCAGPILAAVTSVSATSGATPRIVAVALAYAVGLSAVMLLYGLGGRAVLVRVRRRARGHVVERTMGVVLLATAVVLATNLDVRFEEALAKDTSLPAFLVDPTRSLENSGAVQNRLASLRPPSRFATRQQKEASTTPVADHVGVAIPGVKTPSLGNLGAAPPFTDNQQWFNTPGAKPLTLAGLRGHVVLVDFWTYTCINCIRTLPFVKGLYATYHKYGLEVVGVETPEFTFEQEASNVQQAIHSDGIRYPVVQDNKYGTWNAYQNEYWPAEYLIDAHGVVRHTQFGEGNYREDEAAVRELLYEAGAHRLPPPMTTQAIKPSSNLGTPETYLNPQRGADEGLAQPLTSGQHFYPGVDSPILNEFGLHGYWKVTSQSVTPTTIGDSITGRFQAAHVYLVMTSAGNVPRTTRVLIDGKPIPASEAGADVHGGNVTVVGQRLYSLISLPTDEQQTFTIDIPPGVSAYDFTFG
ncbi:MAG TPA: cytochrome c biogenesis protein CcdA [Solirubrobacteraceae bacterium]|jgi:cytochrome c biogenesis protein CcdA/thiol-disulfide isomerase/thioredoxin|nr:cytochrome c biogenesis protein CcdA [Solirubrobacteraceae bacterium]